MRILIAAFVSFLFQSLYLSTHGRFDDVASLSLFLISVYIVLEAVFALLRETRNEDTANETDSNSTPQPTSPSHDNTSNAHNLVQAQIVNFLAQLQHRGRFIDFVMDDVTGVPDAQVGAAARAVHQGCREHIRSCMNIVPLQSEAEGSTITINAGFNPAEIRLLGASTKEAPFSGRVLHRGWKAGQIQLPILTDIEGSKSVLAPAEVELK